MQNINFQVSKKTSIDYGYKLNNIIIEPVKSFVDLGITFDSKLCFNSHIEKITNKTFLYLGFITRTCSNFNNYDTLRNLYFAFVRSQLEYTSLIWFSDKICTTQDLEAVQNRFLRFLSFEFKVERPQHTEYNGLLTYFNLES
jgi:hypothetical protein